MTITAHNIGDVTYQLFYQMSEGLQGRFMYNPLTVQGVIEWCNQEIEKSRAELRELPSKGPWTKIGTRKIYKKPPKSITEPIERYIRQLERHIKALEADGEKILAEEAREAHLEPGAYVKTDVKSGDLMLYCEEGDKGVYCLGPDVMARLDFLDWLAQSRIPPPPIKGYANKKHHSTGILILRKLTEPQIHFYGNRSKQVPEKYLKGFKPIGRRNLGEELTYGLEEFLRKHPQGYEGRNIGPNNIPYLINGQNGKYNVHLFVEGKPLIFTGISIADIKSIVEH